MKKITFLFLFTCIYLLGNSCYAQLGILNTLKEKTNKSDKKEEIINVPEVTEKKLPEEFYQENVPFTVPELSTENIIRLLKARYHDCDTVLFILTAKHEPGYIWIVEKNYGVIDYRYTYPMTHVVYKNTQGECFYAKGITFNEDYYPSQQEYSRPSISAPFPEKLKCENVDVTMEQE